MGGNQIQVFDPGALDHVFRCHVAQHALVEAAVHMVGVHAYPGSGVGLGVGINQKDFLVQGGQGGG